MRQKHNSTFAKYLEAFDTFLEYLRDWLLVYWGEAIARINHQNHRPFVPRRLTSSPRIEVKCIFQKFCGGHKLQREFNFLIEHWGSSTICWLLCNISISTKTFQDQIGSRSVNETNLQNKWKLWLNLIGFRSGQRCKANIRIFYDASTCQIDPVPSPLIIHVELHTAHYILKTARRTLHIAHKCAQLAVTAQLGQTTTCERMTDCCISVHTTGHPPLRSIDHLNCPSAVNTWTHQH